ncbi:MAG: hypothetical protein JWN90_391 [Parcubacteria group bacterium]|nr:hypothetical protein [Parcubacteria group bacterium]
MNFNRAPRFEKPSEEKSEEGPVAELKEVARKMQLKVEALPEQVPGILEDGEAESLREAIEQVTENA